MIWLMSTELHAHDQTVDAPPAVRVVVIPDSFKGSASALEAAEAMAAGARDAYADRGLPVSVSALPFADGGEGTLDALLGAWGTDPLTVDTTDALGRPTRARFGVSPDGATGVIEAAEANGLPGVADVPLQARTASSRGVGRLVTALLDRGVAEILLCIGGSASTDGGTGMLSALGARFLGADGAELPDGGDGLTGLAALESLVERQRSAGLDVEVHGPLADAHPGIVAASALYVDGEALVAALDEAGFAVHSGSSCATTSGRPSHVLEAMGVLTHGHVRVSVGPATTPEEVEDFLAAYGDAVVALRRDVGR